VATQSAVRTYRTGLSMIVTAGLAAAPPAQADTQYGGNATRSNAPNGPSITLVRHDDGRVTARMRMSGGAAPPVQILCVSDGQTWTARP
jgi:hypothetical protein